MSNWITDRRPTFEDAGSIGRVWTTYNGKVVPWSYDVVNEGTPWMPITPPEPYVNTKRYKVKSAEDIGLAYPAKYLCVYDTLMGCKVSSWLYTREAAERIAAIYEEVIP